MKKIDLKSLLIGILSTMLVFSTLGLRSKTDELGHLVVRSLTIEDDRGVIMGYLGNGYMQTYNQYGEPTLFIGTGKDGGLPDDVNVHTLLANSSIICSLVSTITENAAFSDELFSSSS